MEYIIRENYLKQLIEVTNTPDIKVITGIRRSGKSVLIQEYADYLQRTEDNVNLVVIRLQELDFEELLEYHALNHYIIDRYIPGQHNVLIIDEIQLCKGFEKVINSMLILKLLLQERIMKNMTIREFASSICHNGC